MPILSQKIEEMKKKLAELEAEVQSETQTEHWEPIGGSYFVSGRGKVVRIPSDDERRMFGTERPTEDQAIQARENTRVFNRLLAYRDEFDPNFVEVWNGRTANYFVCYNIHTSEYEIDGNSIYKGVGVVYMSQEVATELARKLNSGEVVL